MDSNLASAANRFPVYFRAPILLTLVWILWGVNVWVFQRFSISYPEILNFDPTTLLSPKRIITSGLLMIVGIVVVIVGFTTRFPFSDVLLFPSLLYLTMIFCLVMPMNYLHRPGRERLLSNLARVVFPAATGVLFVEVLLGDVLTSISKVIADIEVTGCVLAAHMVTPSNGLDGSLNHEVNDMMRNTYSFHEAECADSYMRPLVTSIPFLLRFRQCWVQYRATGKAFPNLLNCCKYLSSMPVIWISALTQKDGHMSRELKAAWIFAVSFNSFFSFMWDIVMDWGLCRQGSKHFLLREQLVFDTGNSGNEPILQSKVDEDSLPENEFDAMVRQATVSAIIAVDSKHRQQQSTWFKPHLVYYLAIMLNFVLRILWSFKLSVHFELSQEGLTFVLEVCEVFRRFVWILFRVEWEAVEKGFVVAVPNNGEKDDDSKNSGNVEMLPVDGGEAQLQQRKPRTRLDWGPVA
ncbi:hypothetical protein BASA81_008017 [Batrachochytrium salamandrivorans]|nr:hypothetical protein BASA81_008017 [Batrachochytrium salamandrivorans]